MKSVIEDLFVEQIANWNLARENYTALDKVIFKQIRLCGVTLSVQFNPTRIISSSAKIDAKSLAARSCFLCKENLPDAQQGIALDNDFMLLVNPFPILKKHFTIINQVHTPQRLTPYISDFLSIAKQMGKNYTLFYNGPKCGASAPDHMHFQAGISEQFPIWEHLSQRVNEILFLKDGVKVEAFSTYVHGLVITSASYTAMKDMIAVLIEQFASLQFNEEEPMLNALIKYDGEWKCLLFPRQKHRPSQYFKEGDEQFLLSPASVDFGGLLALARKQDFERLTAEILKDVFYQLRLDDILFLSLKDKIKAL